MVRRLLAAGAALVLFIVIVLIVSGCLKSEKQNELKAYNRDVSRLALEFDKQVSRPLFTALSGAAGKSPLNVEVQVDQLQIKARDLATRAKGLSVPSELAAAQRNLLAALDLRSEGLAKVAALLPSALGGQGKAAAAQIAGDMEIFLASDVIYSQRVAPLIRQALAEDGLHGLTTAPTRMLANLGWLEPSTALERITGRASSSSASALAPGTHGSALKGVSVSATKLEAEPALNHISGGSNPAFTVNVEDSGENTETNLKTNVTVTAGGKRSTASRAIEKAEPGKTYEVDMPVTGVALGVAAKVEVSIEPVPGETDDENNKGTFLAIFEK